MLLKLDETIDTDDLSQDEINEISFDFLFN